MKHIQDENTFITAIYKLVYWKVLIQQIHIKFQVSDTGILCLNSFGLSVAMVISTASCKNNKKIMSVTRFIDSITIFRDK